MTAAPSSAAQERLMKAAPDWGRSPSPMEESGLLGIEPGTSPPEPDSSPEPGAGASEPEPGLEPVSGAELLPPVGGTVPPVLADRLL